VYVGKGPAWQGRVVRCGISKELQTGVWVQNAQTLAATGGWSRADWLAGGLGNQGVTEPGRWW